MFGIQLLLWGSFPELGFLWKFRTTYLVWRVGSDCNCITQEEVEVPLWWFLNCSSQKNGHHLHHSLHIWELCDNQQQHGKTVGSDNIGGAFLTVSKFFNFYSKFKNISKIIYFIGDFTFQEFCKSVVEVFYNIFIWEILRMVNPTHGKVSLIRFGFVDLCSFLITTLIGICLSRTKQCLMLVYDEPNFTG